jgi:hypothetical protein
MLNHEYKEEIEMLEAKIEELKKEVEDYKEENDELFSIINKIRSLTK